MSDNEKFICANVHPAMHCGAPEMLIFTVLYSIQAAFCLFCFVQHVRHPVPFSAMGRDIFLFFWGTLFTWLIYHNILITAYFNWTPRNWYLAGFCVDSVIQMLPIWILLFMISEMLFTYRNPGHNRLFISRVFLIMALLVLLALGVVLSLSDVESRYGYLDDAMMFWHGVVLIVSAAFVVLPSIKLIQALSWPVLQADDAACVRASSIILIVWIVINTGRGIWDVTAYFGWNSLAGEISAAIDQAKTGSDLPSGVRWFYAIWELIANAVSTALLIAGVLVMRQHENSFIEDPFYAEKESDKVVGGHSSLYSIGRGSR
jgi:hypothetical protein